MSFGNEVFGDIPFASKIGTDSAVVGDLYNAISYFATGSAVTITLYDPITGDVIAIDNSICIEIRFTGVFIWTSTKLTVQPIEYQEYTFKMTNGIDVTLDQVSELILPAPFTISQLNPILHR